MKTENLVFDSYAILGFLFKEDCFDVVEDFLRQAQSHKIKIFLNEINLGEIYYRSCRKSNVTMAKEAISKILDLPLNIIAVDRKFILKAAYFKAVYAISYADAFCLQTAVEQRASVVTGDPEFKKVKEVDIVWI